MILSPPPPAPKLPTSISLPNIHNVLVGPLGKQNRRGNVNE